MSASRLDTPLCAWSTLRLAGDLAARRFEVFCTRRGDVGQGFTRALGYADTSMTTAGYFDRTVEVSRVTWFLYHGDLDAQHKIVASAAWLWSFLVGTTDGAPLLGADTPGPEAEHPEPLNLLGEDSTHSLSGQIIYPEPIVLPALRSFRIRVDFNQDAPCLADPIDLKFILRGVVRSDAFDATSSPG